MYISVLQRCVNEVGSFRCYCPPGWVGSTCTKVIDYCLSQPCNRNGTCLSQVCILEVLFSIIMNKLIRLMDFNVDVHYHIQVIFVNMMLMNVI